MSDESTTARSGPASEATTSAAAPISLKGLERTGLFAEGDLIAGRYRVLSYIASGGIGDVYAVENVEIGTRLALKILQPILTLDHKQQSRFKREIQLASRVTHRNVCRVFSAGIHVHERLPPQPFLTMELLEGETLSDRLEREGPLSPEVALPLVQQMAAALDEAHRVGVIHRDFKCGNIMLVAGESDAGERLVVTDFGLARAVQGDDQGVFVTKDAEGLIGTAAYMAPEQAQGQEPTPATDVYSLGVVLFQMMTGQLPFAGKGTLATLLARIHEKPPSPRRLVPSLPVHWDRTILRCLEREPSERFARAGEMVEALLGQRSAVSARRRRRHVWTAVAAVVVLALGAAFLWTWIEARQDQLQLGDPVQLTAGEGLEVDPAYSPDGRFVVYSADKSGRFELYQRGLETGSDEVRLTSDGGQNFQPSWASTGDAIAYVSQAKGGIWWVAIRESSTPRQLTTFGSRPAWSPLGDTVVFQEADLHEVAERSIPALPPSVLWIVERAGGEPRRLTTAGEPPGGHGEPRWSPDGKRVTFTAGDRRRTGIWTIAADGGAPWPIAADSDANLHPVYSADGRYLYWMGIASDQDAAAASHTLWRRRLSSSGQPRGAPERLARLGAGTIQHLTVAPDGSRLIFGALQTYSHLWSVGIGDGGEPVQLTRGRNRSSRPAFSPDGRSLAFDRWQVGTNLDIWSLDLTADAEAQRLTVSSEWDSQARWLPGGRRFAYFSGREGRRGVWLSDLDAGTETFLTEIDAEIDWAMISPDGRQLAFHSRAGGNVLDVWVQDIASGERRRLTSDPEMAAFPVWSPDGEWLTFEVRRDGSTQIAVMSAEGGGVRQLTDTTGESWPYSWAPDNDRIAFASLRDGAWNLWSVSRTTGDERQLTRYDLVNGYVRYPAWSPDGGRIVYELSRTVGDLWSVDLR